jgi:hypothetical protein
MTAFVVVAGILTGAFAGGCLAIAVAFAVVSRSQERMQRKVRYWQAETARARARTGADSEVTDAEPPRDTRREPAGSRRQPWVW